MPSVIFPPYSQLSYSHQFISHYLKGLMKTYLWEPGARPKEEDSTPEEQAHVSMTVMIAVEE